MLTAARVAGGAAAGRRPSSCWMAGSSGVAIVEIREWWGSVGLVGRRSRSRRGHQCSKMVTTTARVRGGPESL